MVVWISTSIIRSRFIDYVCILYENEYEEQELGYQAEALYKYNTYWSFGTEQALFLDNDDQIRNKVVRRGKCQSE